MLPLSVALGSSQQLFVLGWGCFSAAIFPKQGMRGARGAAGSGNDVLHIQKEWNSQFASATVVGRGKTQKGLAGIPI